MEALVAALLLVFVFRFADAIAAPAAARKTGVIELTGDRQLSLTLTKAVMLSLPTDVADVMIADPTIAEVVVKTPRTAYLIGLKSGDTNAFFSDAAGNRVLTLDIRVDKDLSALRRMLRETLPDVEITVRSANDNIVLSGTVPSTEIAEKARQLARRFVADDSGIVSLLKVARPEQVLIQVRVTEMRRSVARKLGVSLSGSDGNSSILFGAQSAAGLVADRFGQAVIAGAVGGFRNLQAMIEALETDGYVKTLAEPNLTALSGEAASFLAGGEFPIPVGRDDQGRITLQYKQFGVGLKFTPVVLDGGNISLRIATEVSALSSEGALELDGMSVPALTVRRADTAVEIPSGGSLVLGGLLRSDATTQLKGLPGIGNLPIIGQLFRSNDFQHDESELVVIAVPYLVRAVRPTSLSEPTTGFQASSDLEHYFLGKLYERYPGALNGFAAPAPGSFGYIMD